MLEANVMKVFRNSWENKNRIRSQNKSENSAISNLLMSRWKEEEEEMG